MTPPSPRPHGASDRDAPATCILFVCLGNICRSPLAEAVFVHLAAQRGLAHRFAADSCGTGPWHVGDSPDDRAQAIARKFGVPMRHIGRQLDPARDFDRFDLLIAMDAQNRADILRKGGPRDRTHLLRAFEGAPDVPGGTGLRPVSDAPGGTGLRPVSNDSAPDVPDPYSGSMRDFEHVYHLVYNACGGLLDWLHARRV